MNYGYQYLYDDTPNILNYYIVYIIIIMRVFYIRRNTCLTCMLYEYCFIYRSATAHKYYPRDILLLIYYYINVQYSPLCDTVSLFFAYFILNGHLINDKHNFVIILYRRIFGLA